MKQAFSSRRARSAIVASVFVVALGTSVVIAADGPPSVGIPYQGHLEVGGAAYTGTQTLRFRLWDTSAGGVELFDQELDANVADGKFSVVIGDGILPGDVFTSSDLYVEVGMGGAPNTIWLAGRQRIFAAAQAVRASRAFNLNIEGPVMSAPTEFTISNGSTELRFGDGNAADVDVDMGGNGAFAVSNNSGDIITGNSNKVVLGKATDVGGDLDVDGAARVDGELTALGDVDVTGNVQVGFRTITCAPAASGEITDCSCPSGFVAISGGTFGNTVVAGGVSTVYSVRESRPNGIGTWRTGCSVSQFIGANHVISGNSQCQNDTYVSCARLAAD